MAARLLWEPQVHMPLAAPPPAVPHFFSGGVPVSGSHRAATPGASGSHRAPTPVASGSHHRAATPVLRRPLEPWLLRHSDSVPTASRRLLACDSMPDVSWEMPCKSRGITTMSTIEPLTSAASLPTATSSFSPAGPSMNVVPGRAQTPKVHRLQSPVRGRPQTPVLGRPQTPTASVRPHTPVPTTPQTPMTVRRTTGFFQQLFPAASIVVQPNAAAVSTVFSPVPEPTKPESLVEGLPDPDSVDQQRRQHELGLDSQLEQGKLALKEQLKQQNTYLESMGEERKKQVCRHIDAQVKKQEMLVFQRHNEQLHLLEQAAHNQKAVLNLQANSLAMEYSQKKCQEDMNSAQYEMQKQQFDMQHRYWQEMEKFRALQNSA